MKLLTKTEVETNCFHIILANMQETTCYGEHELNGDILTAFSCCFKGNKHHPGRIGHVLSALIRSMENLIKEIRYCILNDNPDGLEMHNQDFDHHERFLAFIKKEVTKRNINDPTINRYFTQAFHQSKVRLSLDDAVVALGQPIN
jgi:hypothetical protein